MRGSPKGRTSNFDFLHSLSGPSQADIAANPEIYLNGGADAPMAASPSSNSIREGSSAHSLAYNASIHSSPQGSQHGSQDGLDFEEDNQKNQGEDNRRWRGPQHDYPLRDNIDRMYFRGNGYRDQDETGDYRPDADEVWDSDKQKKRKVRSKYKHRRRTSDGSKKSSPRRGRSSGSFNNDDGSDGHLAGPSGSNKCKEPLNNERVHSADDDDEDDMARAFFGEANGDAGPGRKRIPRDAAEEMGSMGMMDLNVPDSDDLPELAQLGLYTPKKIKKKRHNSMLGCSSKSGNGKGKARQHDPFADSDHADGGDNDQLPTPCRNGKGKGKGEGKSRARSSKMPGKGDASNLDYDGSDDNEWGLATQSESDDGTRKRSRRKSRKAAKNDEIAQNGEGISFSGSSGEKDNSEDENYSPKNGLDESRKKKKNKKNRGFEHRDEEPPKGQSCAACTHHDLECTLLDQPDEYPCFECRQNSSNCVMMTTYTTAQKNGTKKALRREKKEEKKHIKRAKGKDTQAERRQQIELLEREKAIDVDINNAACTECRKSRARCSLVGKNAIETGPGVQCKRCVMHNKICAVRPPKKKPLTAESARRAADRKRKFGWRREMDAAAKRARQEAADKIAEDAAANKKRGRPRKNADETNGDYGAGSSPNKKKNAEAPILTEEQQREQAKKEFQLPEGIEKKKIVTCYSHPIHFNDDTIEEYHCATHFVHHGMYGLGATQVAVYWSNPGGDEPPGYREIPGTGGHRDKGWGPSRICSLCTFECQRMLCCPEHQIRAICNMPTPKKFNYNAAYGILMGDKASGVPQNHADMITWCSVCPEPAFFECCTHQDNSINVAENTSDGCGLKLCTECATHMFGGGEEGEDIKDMMIHDMKRWNKEHLGFLGNRKAYLAFGGEVREIQKVTQNKTLDEVIAHAEMWMNMEVGTDNMGNKYADGIRADACLLKRDGEMMLWTQGIQERAAIEAYNQTGVMKGKGRA